MNNVVVNYILISKSLSEPDAENITVKARHNQLRLTFTYLIQLYNRTTYCFMISTVVVN